MCTGHQNSFTDAFHLALQDQNRGCCKATKRTSLNLSERFIGAGTIINSISIAPLFIINTVCCRGLNCGTLGTVGESNKASFKT